MPGWPLSMDVVEADGSPSPAPERSSPVNRRKSGRTIRKPDLFSEDHETSVLSNGSAKRKHDAVGVDTEEVEGDDASESISDEESEGEPDEEELREQRRAARKKTSQRAPAAKKAKMANGVGTKLAMRPATNGKKPAKRPRAKKSRSQQNAAGEDDDAEGLFGILLVCTLCLIRG